MKNQTGISVILVNFNAQKYTEELLQHLSRNDSDDMEVILVDNGSSDFDGENCTQLMPDLKIIRLEKNIGFAAANNLAARSATKDYLFFLNNDTIPGPGVFEGLVSILKNHHEIAAVCPILKSFPDDHSNPPVQYAGSTRVNKFSGRNNILHEVQNTDSAFYETDNMHGAAACMRRDTFFELNGFAEDYFLYYEELDLSEKIRNKAYKIAVAPDYSVYHHGSASIGKDSDLQHYYLSRSRVIFMRKWGSGLFWFYIPFWVIKELFLLGAKRNPGMLLSVLKGIYSGIRHKL